MTPEELEDIPGIDEEVVTRIQSTVVAYYSQYDEAEIESETVPEAESAPVDAASIEDVIDHEPALPHQPDAELSEPFKNIETGVLEHDFAKHEAALLEETDEGEVLDLGRVEGLSGAPSSLRRLAQGGASADADQTVESDTVKRID